MRKGVTCHKTENSFVMRFTKEVWLASIADGDGLFANGLYQRKANSKRNGNFVASAQDGIQKDSRKHARSWSVNADTIDNHLLMSDINKGQNQEESCKKFLMDTLRGKVKRHRKSHIAKKSKKKKAMSCQDYDMSTIEEIFANDSTIDYDSDKTVDLSLSQSNNKSGDGSIINSFRNILPTLPDECMQHNFSNVAFKSNSCSHDLATDCISTVSPILHDPNNNSSCQDHSVSTSDLPKFEFMPSVSSVFNFNIEGCRYRSPNQVTVSNSDTVDCKSPKHFSPSFNNHPCSTSLPDLPEDIYILKGPSTFNCPDLLDSTNSSLSTIDFYTNPRLTPLNSPSEINESGIRFEEKNSNNGNIFTDRNLFMYLNMGNNLNVENGQHGMEIYNSFKLNNACSGLSGVNFHSVVAEQVDPKDNSEVFVNKLSLDCATLFCDRSDMKKKVTSKKSSHPLRRGRKSRRQGFTKIGRRKNLKNLRESLKIKNGVDIEKHEMQDNSEVTLQEDTDTDTIPLDLETNFAQMGSPVVLCEPDSRISSQSPCIVLNVDADASVISNLEKDFTILPPTFDVADSTIANISTTITSNKFNANSDFTALRMGGEHLEDEPQDNSTDQSKLEDAGEDSVDDLEIIDLEDIQVNDVITVNFSDLGKVELLQEDAPQSLNKEPCECKQSDESFDNSCVDDNKNVQEKLYFFTKLKSDEMKDSGLIIDLGDPAKNDDCECKSSQESIKIKNTDIENQDLQSNIKTDTKCFGDPCKVDLCKDRAVVDIKDSLRGRKWERANIFENLTAKVNLSLNNENISVTSNFVVDSFAQKLILELTGTRTLSDNDEIKLETKNSFSIENINKPNHICAKIDSCEELYPLEKTSPITVDSDEQIPSDNLKESGYEITENLSFTCKASTESIAKLTEVSVLEKTFDQALQNAATIEPDDSRKTDDSDYQNVRYPENNVQRSPEPSIKQSFKKFPNRFKKRRRRTPRKCHPSSTAKAKSKILSKISEDGAEIESSKVEEDKQPHLSTTLSEASLSEEVAYPEQTSSRALDIHHDSEFVVIAHSSEYPDPSLPSSGPESSPKNPDDGSSLLRPSFSPMFGLNSRVNVRNGVHLTSSFQPLVNIIPLPLESLTRLAMKTNLACDQLRDDSMFEGEDDVVCSSTFSEAEQAPIIAEVAITSSEIGESTGADKCKKITAGDDEGSTTLKKKTSFLEALNESHCHLLKPTQRRSRNTTKDIKKSLADDAYVDAEKISSNNDNNYHKVTKKTATPSIGRKKISPGKSRIHLKRTPSTERCATTSTKRSLPENILKTGMDSILTLMDRTSVMSLPKIRKLSEASSSGPSAQRACESYGVLEKIEKVMAGDEGLKKFPSQNKLASPLNKPQPSASCTVVNQRQGEAAHQLANQTRPSLPNSSDRGTPVFDRNLFEKAFRMSNLPLKDAASHDAEKCLHMKDLPWMRKNKAHDPLGLQDDDEVDNEAGRNQQPIKNTREETKNEVIDESRAEKIKNRINFVKSDKSDAQRGESKVELTSKESHLLRKFRDELQDLEVIIKVHRGMISQVASETRYNRNRHKYGDDYNDNYRRPYWRRNFYNSEERERPYRYEDNRRYYNNRYENRWSTKSYYPDKKDYSKSESSNFQKTISSNLEGDFAQSNAYTDESNRTKMYRVEGENYAEKSYDDDGDDGDLFRKNTHRRQYRNSFQQHQQPQQKFHSKRFPWHNTRRYHKRKYDNKDESETVEKPAEGTSPECRPYHNYRDYFYSYNQDQASNSFHKNKFFDDSEKRREINQKIFHVKSLVKSKLSLFLDGSLIPVESHDTIVDDIMRKLEAMKHNILNGKAEDENEEGECDDSEGDDETDMNLDRVISQYLQEFGSYYVAQQPSSRH